MTTRISLAALLLAVGVGRFLPAIEPVPLSSATTTAKFRPEAVPVTAARVDGVAPPPAFDGPELRITATDPLQSVQLSWAKKRFANAGLELPPLEVSFHDTTEACNDYRGTAATDQLPIRIRICVSSDDEPGLRNILLHELAHAWDLGGSGIPERIRERFLLERGLSAWNDQSAEWPERGAEQAAEIVAWGLSDRPARIPTRVAEAGSSDTATLLEAFRLLTGVEPLWLTRASRQIHVL